MSIKYFDILSKLSTKDKVELLKDLYRDIAGKGIGGDTELAHINSFEAAVLRALGGAGTLHEETGLTQYMGGGSPPPPPPSGSQTVTQQATIPDELKPYITDILSKAKALEERRTAEGYQPYQGQQIAGFTPEQQQAFSGISGLVGTGAQYFDPAARLAAASAQTTTPAMVQQFMSPYMQSVVDIQKREAERSGDVARQGLAAQAVGAGAFGGSRQAILEAEQARNLQQQLGDIQTRGVAAAYEDAQRRIAEQRAREMGAGQFFGQMGQFVPQTALGEYGALAGVGAQRQAQTQSALDIARGQFEAEKTFPEQQLQQYSSIVRGFPLPASSTQYSTYSQPSPSMLTQLSGLGLTGLGIAGGFGAFKKKGGKVGDGKGLASIVVKRADGGSLGLFGDRFKEMQRASRPPYTGPTFERQPDKPEPPESITAPSTIKRPVVKAPVVQPLPPPATEEDMNSDDMQTSRGSFAAQIADNVNAISQANPNAAETAKNFGDDIIQKLGDITKSKKEALDERSKGLESAKWMSVAELGYNILAQPGGQTFLQALGKGAQQANIASKVAGLSDKQKEMAMQLSDLDRQDMMDTFNIKKAQADKVLEERKLRLQERKVEGDLAMEAKKLGITEQHYKDLAEYQREMIKVHGAEIGTKMAIARLNAEVRGTLNANTRRQYFASIDKAAQAGDLDTISRYVGHDDPAIAAYAGQAASQLTSPSRGGGQSGPPPLSELSKKVTITQNK